MDQTPGPKVITGTLIRSAIQLKLQTVPGNYDYDDLWM